MSLSTALFFSCLYIVCLFCVHVCVCVCLLCMRLCMYESQMCVEADKAVNIMITVHDAMHRLKM